LLEHIIITGGSNGLGLSSAEACIQLTLIACSLKQRSAVETLTCGKCTKQEAVSTPGASRRHTHICLDAERSF